MIIPDANLLIFAYESTSPYHGTARAWWEEVLSGEEPVGIPWVVVLAFTRLMTHPTICANPLSTDDVREYVVGWFQQSHIRLLSPTEQTLKRFYDLLAEAGSGGNLTTDALIAAHALEHGAEVYSNDLDFRRFKGIELKNPIDSSERR